MKTHRILLAIILFLVGFGGVFAGAVEQPFDEQLKIKAQKLGSSIDKSLDRFINGESMDNFEKSVSTGMDKAGRAFDLLAKDIDRLIGKMKQDSGSSIPAGTAGTIVEPSESFIFSAPDRSSRGTSYQKGDVGEAAKDFGGSILNLFKALGAWAKSFWKELTGPSKEEAPISATLNELKTTYYKWRLGNAWNKFTSTGGELFGAIGRFAKNLFN